MEKLSCRFNLSSKLIWGTQRHFYLVRKLQVSFSFLPFLSAVSDSRFGHDTKRDAGADEEHAEPGVARDEFAFCKPLADDGKEKGQAVGDGDSEGQFCVEREGGS